MNWVRAWSVITVSYVSVMAACILSAMSRKQIVAFVVAALVCLMMGALICKALDIHDMRPLSVDPEIPLVLLSSMLVFCVGTVAVTANLLGLCFFSFELLSGGLAGLHCGTAQRCEAFSMERLLFSPPQSVISLRI